MTKIIEILYQPAYITINKTKILLSMTVNHTPHIALFLASYSHSLNQPLNILNSQLKFDLETQISAIPPTLLKKASFALATVLAGAVGDAFGYAIEFSDESKIRSKYGLLTDFQSTASDDTQMTIFTILGLLTDFKSAYTDWFRTQIGEKNFFTGKSEAIQARRAPGLTCLESLRGERKKNNSKGCGTVMRVAPIGVFSSSRDEAFERAYDSSKITHDHVDGLLSAGIFAAIIFDLIQENQPENDFSQLVPEKYQQEYKSSDSNRILEELGKLNPSIPELKQEKYFMSEYLQNLHQLGEGWVAEEALAIAILAFKTSKNLRDLCIISANHKGDSDSTASVAGNLFGAKYGLSYISLDSLAKLDLFEEILYTIWFYYDNLQ